MLCKLRDEFLIYNKQDIITKKCFSCKQKDHFITACPLLTLKIDREKVIKNFMENSDYQKRQEFRRKLYKTSIKKDFNKFTKANTKFLNENELLCRFSFFLRKELFYNLKIFYLGCEYLNEIEKKQDELASFFSFIQDDPNSPSMKEIVQNKTDFNKQIQNSLITYEDPINNITTNDLFTKNQRILKKKLTYHSPLLSKMCLKNEDEEQKDQKIEGNSHKNFQTKNFLTIETMENKINNIGNKNSNEISASQRLSYNQKEKNLDLCELALVFESMKCYKSYFPHNNSNAIVKEINDRQNYNINTKKSKRKKFLKRSYITSSINLINFTHSADEIQIKENRRIDN